MDQERAHYSTQATIQLASIYAEAYRQRKDFDFANVVFNGLRDEIERVARDPGLGSPKEWDSVRVWVHYYLGFAIEYCPTTNQDYAIKFVAVTRWPLQGD